MEEKASPVLVILNELRKHCKNSVALKAAVMNENDPITRTMLSEGRQSENTSIAALCDVLREIDPTEIPQAEVKLLFFGLQELSMRHIAVSKLLPRFKVFAF